MTSKCYKQSLSGKRTIQHPLLTDHHSSIPSKRKPAFAQTVQDPLLTDAWDDDEYPTVAKTVQNVLPPIDEKDADAEVHKYSRARGFHRNFYPHRWFGGYFNNGINLESEGIPENKIKWDLAAPYPTLKPTRRQVMATKMVKLHPQKQVIRPLKSDEKQPHKCQYPDKARTLPSKSGENQPSRCKFPDEEGICNLKTVPKGQYPNKPCNCSLPNSQCEESQAQLQALTFYRKDQIDVLLRSLTKKINQLEGKKK
ncbi:unnamed protein product [Ambrosiozyma monospora]|uniref:Unnamed protein product n=1 Tax=Ambrosiozyma monospora TaxID=43982 RepID=A0ACB5U614_AMBMO|nr:unnamed protein product [Ambrosiozyma monospora]